MKIKIGTIIGALVVISPLIVITFLLFQEPEIREVPRIFTSFVFSGLVWFFIGCSIMVTEIRGLKAKEFMRWDYRRAILAFILGPVLYHYWLGGFGSTGLAFSLASPYISTAYSLVAAIFLPLCWLWRYFSMGMWDIWEICGVGILALSVYLAYPISFLCCYYILGVVHNIRSLKGASKN